MAVNSDQLGHITGSAGSPLSTVLANPFFSAIDDDELVHVLMRLEELVPDAGEVLYSAGEPASHLYFLAGGQCDLLRVDTDGREYVVAQLVDGDLFGDEFLALDPVYELRARMSTAGRVFRLAADFASQCFEQYVFKVCSAESATRRIANGAHCLDMRTESDLADCDCALKIGDRLDRLRAENTPDGGDGMVVIISDEIARARQALLLVRARGARAVVLVGPVDLGELCADAASSAGDDSTGNAAERLPVLFERDADAAEEFCERMESGNQDLRVCVTSLKEELDHTRSQLDSVHRRLMGLADAAGTSLSSDDRLVPGSSRLEFVSLLVGLVFGAVLMAIVTLIFLV